MTRDVGGPVVVGVGAVDTRGDALDWAAAEAATRGVALRVVHACPTLAVPDAWGMITLLDDDASVRSAERVVRASVARARAVAPELVVVGTVLRGPVSEVLAAQTRDAALLVLGGRTPRATTWRPGGALHARVAARATCPVAVVRRRPRGGAGRTRPRVVLGVDAAGAAVSAVRFAFQAAEQRGLPLTAVHVRPRGGPAGPDGVLARDSALQAQARHVLDEALDCWPCRFPTVAVERRVVCGDPAAALIAASSGSALLVLGCRRRGPIRRALYGSVGGVVAGLAACPVAVVGADRAARAALRRRHAEPAPDEVRPPYPGRREGTAW